MTIRELRSKVKQFKNKYGLYDCNLEQLTKVTEKQGFTVIEYNHVSNDSAVQSLINSLNLTDIVKTSRGFTYADKNYRLVFVHEDLNEEEKEIILSHENGHIFLGHLASAPILGKDVREEFEANEFSHYLMKNDFAVKLKNFLSKYKTAVIAVCIAVIVAAGGITAASVINKNKQYYGEYYITSTGFKYHKADCVFVKEKNNVKRLTEEQFNTGEYEPCGMCLPD